MIDELQSLKTLLRIFSPKWVATILKHPEKYHVNQCIKLGNYNVGRSGKILTLPLYMGFLLYEVWVKKWQTAKESADRLLTSPFGAAYTILQQNDQKSFCCLWANVLTGNGAWRHWRSRAILIFRKARALRNAAYAAYKTLEKQAFYWRSVL